MQFPPCPQNTICISRFSTHSHNHLLSYEKKVLETFGEWIHEIVASKFEYIHFVKNSSVLSDEHFDFKYVQQSQCILAWLT